MSKLNSNTSISELPETHSIAQFFYDAVKASSHPVYLTLDDICKRYKKSRATIYRRIADGTIPRGVHFGQSLLWRESDLLATEDKLFGGTAHE